MKDVTSSKAAIVFDNLRIVYAARSRAAKNKIAVKGLNLTINEGEVFGFLGPNGAGKTSTMNVLLGFLQPTSGTARINGIDISDPRSRQALGYLPELTYYYKFLSAVELLHFYGKLFGMSPTDRDRRIDQLLKLVELGEAAKRPIRTYSKGMQQRVGIAQALINDPKVLIMDEPTSGLDPLGRNKVRSIIQRLKDEGKTVFFSSHELGEVETVCDRVAILAGGEVRVQGTVEELLREHQCSLEQLFIKIVSNTETAFA
jgi:ABC-2 type transport system ATP-binding protein